MAISRTGDLFKSLEFDGANSRDYGVYITGAAVYNAPEREVEMISIPNRNGAFALDKGRFENIEVTYPAGIFADSETDFAEAISNFRNLLCSKTGYCRLEDDYNPNEYRMAIYKSGLEVDPALLKAGEFEITFECMPQRFLKSGETLIEATSGQTLTNPTLFDARPEVRAYGYGTIDLNGSEIEIGDEQIGETVIHNAENGVAVIHFDSSVLNAGDAITLSKAKITDARAADLQFTKSISTINRANESQSKSNADFVSAYGKLNILGASQRNAGFTAQFSGVSFTYGTAGYVVNQDQFTITFADSTTETQTIRFRVEYDGTDRLRMRWEVSGWNAYQNVPGDFGETTAISTQSALGNPTYIDCDLGICYCIRQGQYIALNHLIDLGSDLPVLNPGANTITFDNTFTKIEVIPKWWKL